MRIPKPFTPVKEVTIGLDHIVTMTNSSVTFGADSFPTSFKAYGHELLAAPMRLVGIENGVQIVWDDDYPENESESFIQSRTDEEITLCGALRCDNFIVDTCILASFDGCVCFDLKLMPRGFTVAEVFAMKDKSKRNFKLDRLWLEIPLRLDAAELYSFYPRSDMFLADGGKIANTSTSYAGILPKQDVFLPFKPLLWIGTDEYGFGWFSESDENMKPADLSRMIELVRDEEHGTLILRIRLLDGQPDRWKEEPSNGCNAYLPLSFRFGIQSTPVKTFPKQPFLHNAVHIDCFIKTPGDYWTYLSADRGGKTYFDRLTEKGVTTLILHEKWNKSQNTFEISEPTYAMIRKIVDECHKRGIKVLTYFGYEIASMNALWSDCAEDVMVKSPAGKQYGGWFRVPYQRDYFVCYHSAWADRFVNGIAHVMDTCHIDGVYLDGTTCLHYCANRRHGCGWTDAKGNLHGTYDALAVRNMMRRLYEAVHERGGYINVHASGGLNFVALPYMDIIWSGEDLQFGYLHGSMTAFPLEHFRAAYTGRNTGVPVELLAYENRPVWNFENAISMALIHGILPRPNDIEGPLEQIAPIWRVFDAFPIEHSNWYPYWSNNVIVSNDKVKVSYFCYKDVFEEPLILAFAVNTEPEVAEHFSVMIPEAIKVARDAISGAIIDMADLTLTGFGYQILWLK